MRQRTDGEGLHGRETGRIVLDASRCVKEANAAAMLLTGGWAVRGTPWAALRPQFMDPARFAPEPEACPVSYCRVFLGASGPRALLMNYDRAGDDLILRFEPLEWTMEFADLLDEPVMVTGADALVAYQNGAFRRRREISPQCGLSEILRAFCLSAAVAAEMMAEAWRGTPLRHEWAAEDGRQVCLVTSPLRYCGRICGVVWSWHESFPVAHRDVHQFAALAYRIAGAYQHEVRNALQTMHAAIVLARSQDRGANADLMDALERSVMDLNQTLSEHTLRRAPALGRLERLSAVVDSAIAHARRRHVTHALSFDHSPPGWEPELRLERRAMRGVFAHLFRNVAQVCPQAHVRVSYSLDGRTLHCTVQDDGPGFPPAVLASVLTSRDFSAHLGLSLVLATVEAQGGVVSLTGAPGGGASVRLSFPLAEASTTAAPAAPAPPPSARVGVSHVHEGASLSWSRRGGRTATPPTEPGELVSVE